MFYASAEIWLRIKDIESTGMLSGMDLPDTETFDVTKRIVITRHSTGPAAVNPKKYKYFTKQSLFDFIENSKAPDYEMTIRFVRFKITDDTYESIATSLSEDRFNIKELKKIYARLVMYNFSMAITLKTPIKEKDLKHHLQVNFT